MGTGENAESDSEPLVRRTLSSRMARWGLVIVGCYLLVALLTPALIGLGLLPDANAGLANPIYDGPSWQHWCGTDRLGRDVCVRTMAGSGVALQVVLLAVGVALLLGVPLGMVSGYLGGAVDRALVLLMDTHAARVAALGGAGLLSARASMPLRRCVVYVRNISVWFAIRPPRSR